jgi:Skp family chaperone for outer membrane proteins
MSLKTEYDSALADSQNVVYSAEVREVRRLKALEVKESMARQEQELRSYNEDSIIRLREMLERMRGDIIKDIQKAAQNIAVIEGYSLVLDKSEDPLRGISFVLYAQSNLDITEKVIQNLNRGYRTNAKDPIDEEKKK